MTISKKLRELMGIGPGAVVDFIPRGGGVDLVVKSRGGGQRGGGERAEASSEKAK